MLATTEKAIGDNLPIEVRNLPPLITINQAAATGAACAEMLRRMCRQGTLRAVKVGTDWRINRDYFLQHFGLLD